MNKKLKIVSWVLAIIFFLSSLFKCLANGYGFAYSLGYGFSSGIFTFFILPVFFFFIKWVNKKI